MRQGSGVVGSIDWISVLLILILAIAGWLNIYAASYQDSYPSPFSYSIEAGKQFYWLLASVLIAVVIFNIEGNFFYTFSPVIYGVVILLLVLVLFLGKEVGGAKAWFGIGSFGIQPSEFSKFATCLVVAQYMSQPGLKLSRMSTKLTLAFLILMPAALILLQPDMGTVLVFTAFIFALYREGLSGNILIAGFGGIVLSSVAILLSYSKYDYPFIGEGSGVILLIVILLSIGILLWFLIRSFVLPRNRRKAYITLTLAILGAIAFVSIVNVAMDKVLQPHQKKRIEILFGLDDDPQGAGYNVKQSKTAIGSGGWTGKGYLKGPFTKYGFVPEQSTDFIFCTVGEEWGFIGSSLVLILYASLIIRIIIISERQRSSFSRIYGYCAASILFFHLLINIGMVIGLAPVIGIPLPFFSYGGSSLMGFTILLSIMLRLDAERLTVLR